MGDAHRAYWRDVHAEVRRRFLAGENLAAICRATGLARGTVHKYAHADIAPERQAYGPGISRLDPYITHLDARLREEHENATGLWREIAALGYDGSPRQVLRYLIQRRSVPAPRTPHRWLGHQVGAARSTSGTSPALPSPRAIALAMTRPKDELAPDQAVILARIEQDAEARKVTDFARRFTALVHAGGPRRARPAMKSIEDPAQAVERWVAETQACGIPPVATFAGGIERDIDTVRAAVTTPWSNGQTEGQINRLKTLKRQIYGRASFDLLRKRMLMAT